MDYIYAVAALASAIAAVLAWVAKIYWSKEHIAAKDETITAKNAQIDLLKREVETLRELTPMKIREYFVSVTSQLEEFNDLLKSQLGEARLEISDREKQIEALIVSGDTKKGEVDKLVSEKRSLEEKTNKLEGELDMLRTRRKAEQEIFAWTLPFDPEMFERISASSAALGGSLTHSPHQTDLAKLTASISGSAVYDVLFRDPRSKSLIVVEAKRHSGPAPKKEDKGSEEEKS